MVENCFLAPQTPRTARAPQVNNYNDLRPILQRAPFHVINLTVRLEVSEAYWGRHNRKHLAIKARTTMGCIRKHPGSVVDGQKPKWPSRWLRHFLACYRAFLHPSAFSVGAAENGSSSGTPFPRGRGIALGCRVE